MHNNAFRPSSQEKLVSFELMSNADRTTLFLLANLRKTLADRLSELRKSRGWTQHDLAAAADVAVDTLRGYEQQKRWPDPEVLESLGRALEVRPVQLLMSTEDFTDVPITVDHALFVLRAYVDATKRQS